MNEKMIGSEGRRKILFWKLYGYLKFMSCDIVSSKIKIYFINLKTFTISFLIHGLFYLFWIIFESQKGYAYSVNNIFKSARIKVHFPVVVGMKWVVYVWKNTLMVPAHICKREKCKSYESDYLFSSPIQTERFYTLITRNYLD